jgi:enoyl-CoA hydratase/carnithine racemase
MPIVAAVNGSASVHSEYALLADVVIASDTTVVSDFPHPAFGIVPGDGMHIAWEEVLGLNRARHLMMTGGSFTAQQALEWEPSPRSPPKTRSSPEPKNSPRQWQPDRNY